MRLAGLFQVAGFLSEYTHKCTNKKQSFLTAIISRWLNVTYTHLGRLLPEPQIYFLRQGPQEKHFILSSAKSPCLPSPWQPFVYYVLTCIDCQQWASHPFNTPPADTGNQVLLYCRESPLLNWEGDSLTLGCLQDPVAICFTYGLASVRLNKPSPKMSDRPS